MKLLSIGNSFSQDAQEWLHQIAVANGVDLETTNLMIGGCSLETHWNNMNSGEAAYYLEQNGKNMDRMVTLDEGLALDTWDVVTVQQVSHHSGQPQTYIPYLTDLVTYVREKCPGKPLLSSECGATGTSRGWYHAASPENGTFAAYDTTINNAFRSRERTWAHIMERDWVMGGYHWDFNEHRGEAAWPRLCSVSVKISSSERGVKLKCSLIPHSSLRAYRELHGSTRRRPAHQSAYQEARQAFCRF